MFHDHVLVCGGSGCSSSNSFLMAEKLKKEIEKDGVVIYEKA